MQKAYKQKQIGHYYRFEHTSGIWYYKVLDFTEGVYIVACPRLVEHYYRKLFHGEPPGETSGKTMGRSSAMDKDAVEVSRLEGMIWVGE